MTDLADDRRRTPRHGRVEEHGIVSARVRPGREASIVDDRRNTFNDDAAASVKTGSGHELASCELHASAQRALGRDRIVKFEKTLPVAAHREDVLVAGSLALGAFEEWPRIAAEVGGGEGAIVGN